MKKLNLPQIQDVNILHALAQNQNLHKTSYPILRQQIHLVEAAYVDYTNSNGNPWNIANVGITAELQTALRTHYKNPPTSLNFIESLRDSSPEVCPMCGGFKPTELDHLLPKEDYPAWSIFSPNLVPACSCNRERGRLLKGRADKQARILHPYFDTCLQERILTTTFTHSNNFSLIRAKVCYVDDNHPEIESIKYHTKNVVIKNDIEGWIRGQLNTLVEFPANVVKGISRRRTIDKDELVEKLEDLLESYDEQTGSKNNWNSILVHGLLNAPQLHDWLVERHNYVVTR